MRQRIADPAAAPLWALLRARRRPRHYAAALLRAGRTEAARLWADAPEPWHALISTHLNNLALQHTRKARHGTAR